MKLIGLNTNFGKQIDKIFVLVDKERPDFVCFQEIFRSRDKGLEPLMFKHRVLNFFNLFEKRFGDKLKYSYYSPTLTTTLGGIKADYGNAYFSTAPILSSTCTFFHLKYFSNFCYPDNGYYDEPRNMQTVDVNVSNQKIKFINLHGIYQHREDSCQLDTAETIELSKQILSSCDPAIPTIITGDFNLIPETSSIKMLSTKFFELVTNSGIKSTKSSTSGFALILDYVFVNSNIIVKNFTVPDLDISDHKPLILEFEI